MGVVGRELVGRAWFRSSYSVAQGECVEVAAEDRGRVLVRDSKQYRDAVLAFRHEAWCGFLAGLVDPEARGI
ncbi:DUF397 domain-containing protein [Streptomyces pseudovenezuelae]|uniref:DUF397 domain-containing protein n=1 Tax=Streptomyces pseudovenezuelae TaxID=67350 RepID=UPI002E32ABB1|nr:DUF397 domain-containing protein [Streptomyces pseudovenezuelae]